jgi:hypothetical protein
MKIKWNHTLGLSTIRPWYSIPHFSLNSGCVRFSTGLEITQKKEMGRAMKIRKAEKYNAKRLENLASEILSGLPMSNFWNSMLSGAFIAM